MSNLKEFHKALEKQEKGIYKEVEDITKEVTLGILDALKEPKSAGGTPVITGWLVSNWIISINTSLNSPVGARENIAAAVNAQKSSVQNFKNLDLLDTKMIYINNSVPYGPSVNYGSRSQPAQYFREDSLERAKIRLNKNRVIK